MNRILLGSAITVLLFAGCGDEKKTTTEVVAKVATEQTITKEVGAEATKVATDVTNTAAEATNKVVENTTEVVKEATSSAMEATNTAVVATTAKVEEVKDATKEVAVSVVEDTKEKASNAVSEATTAVKTVANTVAEKTETALATATEAVTPVVEGLDGELLFKSCASCHGQKAEKEALGKSQVIAGWEKEKIIQALNGYKDGTYGGVMKNIMKGQVASKTDAEIDALATFISKL
jgi:cytochrome c553